MRPMFLFQHTGQLYTTLQAFKLAGAVAAHRGADLEGCTGTTWRRPMSAVGALMAGYGDTDRRRRKQQQANPHMKWLA